MAYLPDNEISGNALLEEAYLKNIIILVGSVISGMHRKIGLFHQIILVFFYVFVNTVALLLAIILKLFVTIIVLKYTAHQRILEK